MSIYDLLSNSRFSNYVLGKTVTQRNKSMDLSDIINAKDIEVNFYGSTKYCGRYDTDKILPRVLGVAIQTYYSKMMGTFEPSDYVTNYCLVKVKDRWVKDYSYANAYKELVENTNEMYEEDVIYFCIEYANILDKARPGLKYKKLEKKEIVDPSLIHYFECKLANISMYQQKRGYDVEYDEVALGLKHAITKHLFGYNYSFCHGDLDYITNEGILDFKCCYNFTNDKVHLISQQLIYLIMGKYGYNSMHIPQEYFKKLKYVICYNPLRGEEIAYPLHKLKHEDEIIKRLFIECYREGDDILYNWFKGREKRISKKDLKTHKEICDYITSNRLEASDYKKHKDYLRKIELENEERRKELEEMLKKYEEMEQDKWE